MNLTSQDPTILQMLNTDQSLPELEKNWENMLWRSDIWIDSEKILMMDPFFKMAHPQGIDFDELFLGV